MKCVQGNILIIYMEVITENKVLIINKNISI